MKVNGRVKLPPRSSKPMMIGAVMPASPPTPLKTPLVSPISRSGAVAETRTSGSKQARWQRTLATGTG